MTQENFATFNGTIIGILLGVIAFLVGIILGMKGYL